MKLPRLKYNAAEIASLTVLLAVAAILAAVLLARSCSRGADSTDIQAAAAADSIVTALDSCDRAPAIAPKQKKSKKKTVIRPTAERKPISRDYLDEPINE